MLHFVQHDKAGPVDPGKVVAHLPGRIRTRGLTSWGGGGYDLPPMRPKKPEIKVEYGTDVTIATFRVETILEERQMRELEADLLAAVEKNEDKRLVLNFENVSFMSSAFLGLLVKVHKRVIEAGGRLQLFNLDPRIYKVFEITKLTNVFDIKPLQQ
jgi:anti-sigma B factor antagonist